MSAVAKLLDRLKRVERRAPDRWVAACPIHNRTGQALSIREVDGRVLLHDFGGCGTDAVLDALGLTVADLFEERLPDAKSGKPNHWHARREAFESIHKECLLVAIAAESIAAGIPLSVEDRNRLCQASHTIRTAVEVCR